jgi:hypothetical protein
MRLARGLTLALALLGPASTAQAAAVGLADQQPASYADARARALGLRYARLTVPWDAATSQPQAVAAWLAAVRAAGMTPHVAFEHLATDRCPQRPCTTPTAAQYGAAVRRLVALFPQVRTYTTWNEANHASQPVADDPEAVAAYYGELRAACAGCTVVAGDVLDSGSYRRWLERFLRASTTTPPLWGLHDYGDVTYGRTTGVDSVLATVPGALWIEETGGLVALRNAAGRATFAATEASAATAIDRAFAIAAAGRASRGCTSTSGARTAAIASTPVSCAPTAAPARATRRSRATSRRSAPCAGGRRGPHGAPGGCCCARRAPRARASAAAG